MCLKHAEIFKINCTLKKNLGKKEEKKRSIKCPRVLKKYIFKKIVLQFLQFKEDLIYSIIKYWVFVFYA